MIIFPAIDIRGGKCVRLTEGRFDQETIFADKPLEMAKQWVAQGAQYLHLVDLDGALKGASVNTAVIKEIVDFEIDIPIFIHMIGHLGIGNKIVPCLMRCIIFS